MEGVRTIVDGQLIVLAAQTELAAANAVAKAPDEGRQIRLCVIDGVLDVVISLNNVGNVAIPVRNHDGYDGSTVIGDGYLVAKTVFEYKQIGVFPIDSGLKVLSLQATEIFCFDCAHNIWFLVW